jgi:carboxyl-terminal processing protease
MKKSIYFLACLVVFLSGCTKALLSDTPDNEPEAIFETFWQQINKNYSGKDVRPVNWDSLYTVYRPQITPQTTDNQLITIFSTMLTHYKDGHLGFSAKNQYYTSNKRNTNFTPDYLGRVGVEKVLKKTLKTYKNIFSYEKNADNIGYVHISTFDGRLPQVDFEFFNTIIEELRQTKGIIIDIRSNQGGNEAYARIIAERFATSYAVYKYTRTKIGLSKDDYSEFLESGLSPSNNWQYINPVVVLTDQLVFSTAINFLLMMQVQRNVTTLGTITGDGVNGGVLYELPNGWSIQMPFKLSYLPDKTVVEGKGVKPKIEATISEEQKKNGQDAILEKALELLK